MNLGFTPGSGITRLLEHVLSPALAHELMYTGEFRRGADFSPRSGVNYVLPGPKSAPKHLSGGPHSGKAAGRPGDAQALAVLDRRRAFEATRTVETMMHEITFRQDAIRERIEDSMWTDFAGRPSSSRRHQGHRLACGLAFARRARSAP
jgi:enoyl-CoA hydratase/carnithine racemase